MKKYFLHFLSVITAFSLLACTVSKPVYNEQLHNGPNLLKNDMLEFKHPRFEKTKKDPGIEQSFTFMSVLLLADLGLASTTYYSIDKMTGSSSKLLPSLLIIATVLLTTGGVAAIVNYYSKDKNTEITQRSSKKWVKEYNKTLYENNRVVNRYYENSESIYSIVLVPNFKEKSFIIESAEDAYFYIEAFYPSVICDSVLKQYIIKFDRAEKEKIFKLLKNPKAKEYFNKQFLIN